MLAEYLESKFIKELNSFEQAQNRITILNNALNAIDVGWDYKLLNIHDIFDVECYNTDTVELIEMLVMESKSTSPLIKKYRATMCGEDAKYISDDTRIVKAYQFAKASAAYELIHSSKISLADISIVNATKTSFKVTSRLDDDVLLLECSLNNKSLSINAIAYTHFGNGPNTDTSKTIFVTDNFGSMKIKIDDEDRKSYTTSSNLAPDLSMGLLPSIPNSIGLSKKFFSAVTQIQNRMNESDLQVITEISEAATRNFPSLLCKTSGFPSVIFNACLEGLTRGLNIDINNLLNTANEKRLAIFIASNAEQIPVEELTTFCLAHITRSQLERVINEFPDLNLSKLSDGLFSLAVSDLIDNFIEKNDFILPEESEKAAPDLSNSL
tara:strand:- start:37423 stop:38568 length:1146 start_codon:yes stop_codon:yes gene_type:complete